MDNLAKLRLEFLEETVNYYNSTNRGAIVDDTGCEVGCSYAKGCAIGRHLTPELCDKLDNLPSTGVSSDMIFELLPENIASLGQKFLEDIQDLHDDSSCWDEKGLKGYGESRVQNIMNRFKLYTNGN